MKTSLIFFALILFSVAALHATDFPYGKVSHSDLVMTAYPEDTSAVAVVLKEYGEAAINDGDDYHLVYKYHVRIKILHGSGLDQANVEIPLYRQDSRRYERIDAVKASAFNIVDGRIQEVVLDNKDIFTEQRSDRVTVKKFAIPGVRAGSVIEYTYTLNTPFIFNFHSWEFQSDIPKMESEYQARIPGVYLYNITLRGFLELDTKEDKIMDDCIRWGSARADCLVMRFAMKDIPAFVEEDYMTAKKNFLSAIHFELAEIRYFDGRVDKITREWKDAEEELRRDSRFGGQLKRGKEIGQEVQKLVEGEDDALVKAEKVYDFIKNWFQWNDTYGKYSEFGVKKAFDERKGNVGDINLALIAALRFAGLDVEPVILSTRANGLVVELYPVLSEFNYVIAKINIGDNVYFADATEEQYPFGLLPERCLNGKGRVVGDRDSYWVELKPAASRKTLSLLSLKLEDSGVMRGTLQTTFQGYEGVSKRTEIRSFTSEAEYIRNLQSSLTGIMITGYELENVSDAGKPLIRKLDIEVAAFDTPDINNFLFNPFLLDKWTENPFKSKERLYPVDFGVPVERTTVFNLEYPDNFEVINIPEKVGLMLPNGGGRFLYEVRALGNRISMSNTLSLRKTIYNSTEYHYLKELFGRIIQAQNADLIFHRKM